MVSSIVNSVKFYESREPYYGKRVIFDLET